MQYLLGIDAGTTSIKAGLFEPGGRCLAVERQEYHLSTPQVDRAELNPEIYWQACIATVKKALRRANIDPQQVAALAVSSQGETTITLDSMGKPIYPAIVWLDNRAIREADKLANRFSNEVYQVTGIPEIIPTWTGCKILWLRENEPQVFARAAKFLLVQDYLIYRLTGEYVTNGSVACTSLLYDIIHDAWWQPALEEIGIAIKNLPQLVPPGTCIGHVAAEVARQVGLSSKTKVVSGGMDQCVGAIGAGNIQPGTVSETTGAALVIQATILNPALDQSKVIPVYYHSVADRYLFAPVCPTAGMAYKWFRDTFAAQEMEIANKQGTDPFDLLNQLAESAPPGCDGLVMLPHLMGAFSPNPNPVARGTFTGFTLRHNRAHFGRAVLEGVAFLLKNNLEHIQKTGVNVIEIRSTGGGARSGFWNQIKSNVCNLPVITLLNEETALIGDAILAGVASGVFDSINDGVNSMVKVKDRITPNEEVDSYRQPYQMYCSLDQSLKPYFVRNYKNDPT